MTNSTIKRIFLLLGQSSGAELDFKVKEWIREQIPPLHEKELNLTFYSGDDPLLCWDTIKDVVENIKGNIQYSILTNGMLITANMVDYINDYDIEVVVTWDGVNSAKIHGFNAVKDNSCILDINNLNFLAKLGEQAYPLDILDEAEIVFNEYKKIHGVSPSIDIETNIEPCALDYAKLSQQMEYIVKHKDEKLPYRRIIDRLQRQCVLPRRCIDKRAFCGNGYFIWNIDTNGNVYQCRDSWKIIGTVFDSSENIHRNMQISDPTYSNYLEQCSTCPVQALCRSGCPLIDAGSRDKYYCDIKKAYLSPVIQHIREIRQER